uniref:Uncharacterized protein n=1 Tax=Arundo donax TaxID=35708 RepID=A0A0A9CFM7_ARUDO
MPVTRFASAAIAS